jgi:hypothetical protein
MRSFIVFCNQNFAYSMGVASSQLVRTVDEDIGMIVSGCEGDSSVHFRNIGAVFCIKKKLQIIFKKGSFLLWCQGTVLEL